MNEYLRMNFENYDGYCRNMYEGEFYIEWLNVDEFIERLEKDKKFRKEWLVYTKKDIRKKKLQKINESEMH